MKAKEMERKAGIAIKLLRIQKLSNGHPFMINSGMLEPHQCFLEFPNGIFKIVEVDNDRADFRTVFEFSMRNSNRLRKKFGLKKFAE